LRLELLLPDLGVHGLAAIVRERRAPEPLRGAAHARLITRASQAVKRLGPTTRRVVRDVRGAATALADTRELLSSAAHDEVAALARAWTDWFVSYQTAGDWFPLVCTAIAWAKVWPDETVAARERIHELIEAGAIKGRALRGLGIAVHDQRGERDSPTLARRHMTSIVRYADAGLA
jgi:hypothetical protein